MFLLPGSRGQTADCNAVIVKIISTQLRIDRAKTESKARIAKDLGADELDTIAISLAVEEELGVEISNDILAKIVTVDDLVQFANNHAEKGCR